MRTTKVIELRTVADVKQFCATLLRLKDEAPKSLTMLVAVTADQQTELVIPPELEATRMSEGHHIQMELDKLDKRRKRKVRKVVRQQKSKRKPQSRKRPPKYKRRARPTTTIVELK
jgi:hypothetical protein